MLASYYIPGNGDYFDMSYSADGKRVQKTQSYDDETSDWVTTYIYNGNNLVCQKEEDGSLTYYKYFLYNSQGIIGYIQDGVTYTYRKNLFGDITAIYQGATKVAEYAYDAWGNCTVTNLTSSKIGSFNPFRYRGYYWDEDLQLYYLMSRYYDPQTGRFISPARVSDLNPQAINGLNLYSYAGNNPIAAYQVVTNSNTYANRNRASSRASNAVAESSTPSKASLPKFPDELQYLSYVDDVVASVLHVGVLGKYLLGNGKAHTAAYLAEMRLFGINPTRGLMSLPKASWIGAISSLFAVIDTTMSVYNNIQEGDSFGEILLDGALTFGISFGAAWLGGIIGSNIGGALGSLLGSFIPIPGLGTFIGFVVGTAVSILVTWFVKDVLNSAKEGFLDWIFG